MIYLYSGTPGSGKSLHLADEILFELRVKKHNVIANITINYDLVRKCQKRVGKFFYFDNSVLTPKVLIQYAKKHHKKGKEGQTLLVIDECAIMFNSREYSNPNRMEWIKFFQMHRHFGFNIILVSQSDRLIDRQIRAFIEYDIRHRKANNFGAIGFIFTLLGFKVFAAISYWYGLRERLGAKLFLYRPILGKLYDSYTMFGTWDG
jgi:zona occludens toxin (predicted ATPase)